MKTLLVCDEKTIHEHVGEEYDEILEVSQIPTTEDIKEWATKIKSAIRRLWNQDINADDRRVVLTLDSSAPYKAVVINLRIILGVDEDIVVDLPGLDDSPIPEKEDQNDS
jgi:hypothetical protein